MNVLKIEDLLQGNTYPGRGILVGKSADCEHAVIAYFIMGRSENSRNRVFVPDGEGIRTEAFISSKLTDPSLTIYAPVRVFKNTIVVTNGDHTDTIYHYLKIGKTFAEALRTRAFEPDAPNYTPRISAVGEIAEGRFSYKLSILKCSAGDSSSCERFFYEYDKPFCGEGRFIHTYACDGDPIPSFSGEPKTIAIEGDIDTFTNRIWENLHEENKVSLFVRYVEIKTGKSETRILNKNQ